MKRPSSRKVSPSSSEELGGRPERRRKPRKSSPIRTASSSAEVDPEVCAHCAKELGPGDRALFVEEERGRSFCGEDCIGEYFSPEVERLEMEYHQIRSQADLQTAEREELSHLRWSTLREPDEVWREKTLSGDYRHTLIAEFQPLERRVWCVCLSLFLRGEPSFLFLSIITRNEALVDRYRKGERMRWVKRSDLDIQNATHPKPSEEQMALDGTQISDEEMGVESVSFPTDGLADGWSAEEAVRAALNSSRRQDDIPQEDFSSFQACIEETLQSPDQVWSLVAETTGAEVSEGEDQIQFYHFIKHYPSSESEFWYVIVAKEVPEEEHLEVLEAFPTRDEELVARYRQGRQEHGMPAASVNSERVLH